MNYFIVCRNRERMDTVARRLIGVLMIFIGNIWWTDWRVADGTSLLSLMAIWKACSTDDNLRLLLSSEQSC